MLPEPTAKRVQRACDTFDKKSSNKLGEEALAQLLFKFPRNMKASHVLLKVIALDQRYSTRIQYIDIDKLALHIAKLGIDKYIDQGSHEAVDLIWNCPQTRKYYSFATKFCSWHKPTVFPIYDRNVDECLWAYKERDRFANFHRKDLKDYKTLVQIVTAYRSHYNLDDFSYRQLDRFMWNAGDRILRERTSAL
jgi:hypothetical protein